MAFERSDRISEEVRRALDRIIRDSVKDPRVCGTWSITRAEVTRDLRLCKVRISVLEDDVRDGLIKALKNAAGFIRHELGSEVDIRYTPELVFELDKNIEYAAHIQQILTEEDKRHAPKAEDSDAVNS